MRKVEELIKKIGNTEERKITEETWNKLSKDMKEKINKAVEYIEENNSLRIEFVCYDFYIDKSREELDNSPTYQFI